jgi:hypothetical protein
VPRGRGRSSTVAQRNSILDATRSELVGLCSLPPRPCRAASGLTGCLPTGPRGLPLRSNARSTCLAALDRTTTLLTSGSSPEPFPRARADERANTPRPSSPGVRTRSHLAARRASFAPPSTTRKVHRPKAGFPPGAPAARRETRRRDRARPLPEHRSDRARTTADVNRDRRYSSGGLFGRRQAMPSDSCSDLAVLHRLAGLLRARAAGVSACCRPWGSLRFRPWKPRPPRSALTPRRTSPRISTSAVTRGDCPRAVPVASSSRSS